MGISLGKGLLIAGGLGALGVGGFMLFNGKDKAGDAEPAGGSGEPQGGAAGDAAGAAPVDAAGTGAAGQAQQVGNYTVIPDELTGLSLVVETATKQPVGLLDANGNVTPIAVDANGNVVISQDPSTASVIGGSPSAGTPAGTGTGAGTVDAAGTTSTRYAQIAAELFANAGNGSVGSATSDAAGGVTNLQGVTSPTGTGAATTGGAATGGVTSQQVGEYTVVSDGSGTSLIYDTATQTPLGVLDASGYLTPVSVDASGNLQKAGEATFVGDLTGGASAGAGTAAAATTATTAVPAVGALSQ